MEPDRVGTLLPGVASWQATDRPTRRTGLKHTTAIPGAHDVGAVEA